MNTMAMHRMMNPRSSQQESSYDFVAVIGRGAYGTVYKARDMLNEGRFVAIKKMPINTNTAEGMPMVIIREIAMLKQLEKFEHPNIARLLGRPGLRLRPGVAVTAAERGDREQEEDTRRART